MLWNVMFTIIVTVYNIHSCLKSLHTYYYLS
jgi:hypothetical protein